MEPTIQTPAKPEPISPTNNTLQKALENHRKMAKIDLKDSESPHILIVGATGSGKSRSIINLPPEHTLIFNPEAKPLPFPDSKKFDTRKLSGFTDIKQIETIFDAAVQDPSIRYIVFDSFTEWIELLVKELQPIKEMAKGDSAFLFWNKYADAIRGFLFKVRQVKNKIIILTSLDELTKTEQDTGALKPERFASCQGQMFTKIETKFSIVLFTNKQVKVGTKPPEIEYQFATKSDGYTSSKSPEGMFPFYIPNDLNYVVKRTEEYFGIKYK